MLRDLETQVAAALFVLSGGGEALPLSALEAAACDSAREPDPNRRRKMTPARLRLYQFYQCAIDRYRAAELKADRTSDRTRPLTVKSMH